MWVKTACGLTDLTRVNLDIIKNKYLITYA